MNAEDYLIDIKPSIIAITRISQLIEIYLEEYDYQDIKKEIYALNRSIRMILFCMRREHLQFYKEIEPNYKDDFTYESIIYSDIC